MSKKSPQLRFEGFTDDWEERKLRDLLNKNSEKNKNLSVINVESVSNKTGFTKQTDQFEDYSVASADLSNYYVIREKQFAYNPSRINVGSIAYKDLGDEISVVSPLYVSFSTKKVLNDGFLWNWFKTASFDAQRQRLSEGGVRDTLSFNQLSEMNTLFPTYPEQEKIGSFFKQLDITIALHQRELDLLSTQKKTLLQKMFPKDGESIPELRFDGFTDPWEQRKLGDITSSYSGGTPSVGNKSYYGGDIPFIRSAEINADSTELFITQEGLRNSSAKLVEQGDILYAMYGATSGEVGRSRINGAINQAILAIKPTFETESEFLAQWLRAQKENIINTFLQGGQGNLSGSIIKNLVVDFPKDTDEQIQIGNFFQQLDATITLHQRELEQLKEMKKSLLNKLFV